MDEVDEPMPSSYPQGFQLVGEFMFYWAALEQAVNRGLSTLLDLGNLEGAIVEANMQWRDKIHALRTCVNLWPFGSEEWGANADKFLVKLGGMSGIRNIVAHTLFVPRKDGGVKFYVTQAKGKLAWPELVWSTKQFQTHFRAMREATEELGYIIDCVASERPKRPTAEQFEAFKAAMVFGLEPRAESAASPFSARRHR